jgi:SAM-dependent methyltransferase
MTLPQDPCAIIRSALLDDDSLVAAVAAGRQRGKHPAWRRVELRYVDLADGCRLQVTSHDDTQARVQNHPLGQSAEAAVDRLLAEPFGSWRVETRTNIYQLRTSKRGVARLHTEARVDEVHATRGHDRAKSRLLDPADPVLIALGISTPEGQIKPSKQAKYRQVDAFLRILDHACGDALENGQLRRPTSDDPLRVADLGCGNAYLTFAADRYLSENRRLAVAVTGVDTKEQARTHNTALAARLGGSADFIVGSIATVSISPPPEVVLALHACDTATDDALARAIQWRSPVVLAAPCCHHDISAQLRVTKDTGAQYALLTKFGILREHFAECVTDSLRAALLRLHGYRVDVMEFVESRHTPRNTLLCGVRTGAPPSSAVEQEYTDLIAALGIRPRLAELLGVGRG